MSCSWRVPVSSRRCNPLSCPSPLENGRHSGGDQRWFKVGQVVQYSCLAGYRLDGDGKIVCQYSRSYKSVYWRGSLPKCLLDDDEDSSEEEQSYSETSESYSETSESYSESSESYSESSSYSNTEHDSSTPSPAQNPMVRCPHLSDPENGMVHVISYSPGGYARYRCNHGYLHTRILYRKCLSNGSWTGQAPRCFREKLDCPVVMNPRNGRVKYTEGTKEGARIWYICNAGHTLYGEESRTCLADRTWSGSEPTCKRDVVECPELMNPSNGRVKYTEGRKEGARVWYVCNMGFKLEGEESRKCLASGSWSGSDPTCRPIQCPEPEEIENGSVNYSSRTIGSKATYRCRDGFVLRGHGRRWCQRSLVWAPQLPSCERKIVECPVLKNPSNGRVKYTEGRKEGARVWYVCNMGFRLKGVESRKCQADGSWSGSDSTCEREIVECPVLKNPSNGRVKYTEGRKEGARVWYVCNMGFRLKGMESRKCLPSGSWSGSDPTCEREIVECPVLKNPSNGRVKYTEGRKEGARVWYVCNMGFRLKGMESRKCLPSGSWSGSDPTCDREVVECPVLKNPSNGRVKYTEGRKEGARVWYVCNMGFRLKGVESRKCQADGSWSGSDSTCEREIECPVVKSPSNGRVKYTEGRKVGARIWYICNSGYALYGDESRRCLDSGAWSGSDPICKPIQCPQPEGIENGSVNYTTRNIGSKANYECEDGFVLKGSNVRICQGNLMWSPELPRCEKRTECERLKSPKNGFVIVTSKTIGSHAKYNCREGFYLSGPRFRECLPTGWSDTAPKCLAVLCDRLEAPEYGKVKYSNGLHFNSTATYSCDFCYTIDKDSGDTKRRCQNYGEWTGRAPKCIRVDCGKPEAPSNGSVWFGGTGLHSRAIYSCAVSHSLRGVKIRSCLENGQWSGAQPSCEPKGASKKYCSTPSAPANGQVHFYCLQTGCHAQFSCNRGYKLVGRSSAQCLQSQQWTSSAPRCVWVEKKW